MGLENDIIEIKREFGEFDKVRFAFRYLGVNENQKDFIENKLNDLVLRINKIKNENFVIVFPLTKDILPDEINRINKQLNLPKTKFGISISFTTCYDHSGFRLPQEISDFYQEVGGQFDCSIIMIGEKD